MSETSTSMRSKSLPRSLKSVAFSGSSAYIPAPEYIEEPVPELSPSHRSSAPPVPYFHAPDDFPVDDDRCCALWPNCGDARSVLSYSERGDSDSGSAVNEEDRPGSSSDNVRIDVASNHNMTRIDSRHISPVRLPAPTASISGCHPYRSRQSDVTLVESIKNFEEEIEKRWSDVSSRTTYLHNPVRYTLSKGDIVGADEIDLEKQYLPEFSVVKPETKPSSYIVKFDGPNDPLNPKNWSSKKKWSMTLCVASFTFLAPLTSSMPAPALPQLAKEFGITSDIETQILLSIFVLAFAIGPVIFGPLSELYGRVIVLQAANVLFLAFTIGCGFAQSEAQMMIFRFFAGLGGSAPLAIGGGVLGDLFLPQERGKAMAIYGMGPLLGPSVGPIVGSFVAADSTWRWMFWAASAASVVVLAISFIFLHESYAPLLLERKAAALRKSSGVDFYKVESSDPNRTVAKSIASTLMRALKMLFTQPIVQVMALYMAYAYGTMYLVLATFPTLWRDTYNESPTIAGLNYISLGLGFFLGSPITGKGTDKIYRHLTAKHMKNGKPPGPPQPPMSQPPPYDAGGSRGAPPLPTPSALSKLPSGPLPGPGSNGPLADSPRGPPGMGPPGMGPPGPRGKPEYRLPLIIPFSLLPPIGLCLYGWSAQYHLHWIFPNVGAFLFAFGTVAAFQSVTAYLIDTYTKYAASAIAAVTVLRSLAGFGFPIFAPKMYEALGMGWGNSLLGFAAVVIGCSAPVLLYIFGERLRKKSTLAVG